MASRRKIHLKRTNRALHLSQTSRSRRLKQVRRRRMDIAARHALHFVLQQDA